MIIVLIHWKIKPEKEMVDQFFDYWRTEVPIDDRQGLIGEFLSEALTSEDYEWINWKLTDGEGKYKSFINVGYWNSVDHFESQVGTHIKTAPELQAFEAEPRERIALTPECWRIGESELPLDDSAGVL